MTQVVGSYIGTRIIGAPPAATHFDRYGYSPRVNDEISDELARWAFDDYMKKFDNSKARYPGRFNSGSFPVLYFSGALEVALAEKSYYLDRYIFSILNEHTTWSDCIAYVGNIKGKYIDIFNDYKKNKELVNPSKYTICQNLSDEAFRSGIDFLRVASARYLDGVNYPCLRREAFSFERCDGIISIGRIEGNRIVYKYKGTEGDVKIDNVYELI